MCVHECAGCLVHPHPHYAPRNIGIHICTYLYCRDIAMLMYRFSVNFGLLGFAKNNAVKRSRRQNTRKPDRVGRKKTCRSVTDFLRNGMGSARGLLWGIKLASHRLTKISTISFCFRISYCILMSYIYRTISLTSHTKVIIKIYDIFLVHT